MLLIFEYGVVIEATSMEAKKTGRSKSIVAILFAKIRNFPSHPYERLGFFGVN
jgi:hypothetical protein